MISTVVSRTTFKTAKLTGKTTFIFSSYLKGLLPTYIVEQDSYKDANQEGFIVRFLKIFGYELNEYYYNKIENLPNEWSPLTLTNGSYLDYIAYALGDIPDFAKDEAAFRRLLTFLVSIYKVKGRVLSFKAILYPASVKVTSLTEVPLLEVNYDVPGIDYDDEYLYDENCATCSEYDLNITITQDMTADLYNKILSLIALVEPIGAKLRTIIANGNPVTEVHITVEVDINGDLIYDNVEDPGLILTLTPDGDLIISGPNADRYYISEGDLIWISY